jgi:rhodanese-related sulfurtransferase
LHQQTASHISSTKTTPTHPIESNRIESNPTNTTTTMSYEDRMHTMGLAPKEDIKKVLTQDSHSVILDVRSQAEIDESGKFQVHGRQWFQAPVMPGMTDELVKSSQRLFPNKDAPIVVYCRSGNRARFAKQALEEQGYKCVLNAGGYDDIANMNV